MNMTNRINMTLRAVDLKSAAAIEEMLDELGVDYKISIEQHHPTEPAHTRRRRATKDDFSAARKLLLAGHASAQVAAKLGFSQSWVTKNVTNGNIKL